MAPLAATARAQELASEPLQPRVENADSAVAATAEPPIIVDHRAPLRLEASLTERRIVVKRGGEILAEYPISVGMPEYRTPTGSFTIEKLIWNPAWVPPDSPWARDRTAKGPGEPGNPMKVVKIFFQEPDYYIHGTNDRASLGQASSHGCLRMSPVSVTQLARMVMQHGGAPRDDDWFTEVIVGDETRVVRLDTPVELVVVR
ncbi:MAG TPA: L,D-transpeptidase family protein [Gemmatimonadales bacterium]